MLCINLHKQIDETKSNDVMYVFAQINEWNKIERCYVCDKLMKQNQTMLCMHLHKQIDETK